MKALYLYIGQAVVLNCLLAAAAPVRGYNGTTPDIESIFVGRCLEYQELPNRRLIQPVPTNCTELWNLFLSAWSHQDPADVRKSDYLPFIQTVSESNKIPVDKALLWSGSYSIAHEYANEGERYVTLEDTLGGYIVNGLTWCGRQCTTVRCDGINYKQCPDISELPAEARTAFWGGMSSAFAKSAEGSVNLMLSGSNKDRPAYITTSILAMFELPNLTKGMHVNAILVNDVDKIALEHCDSGSMLDLQADVLGLGLQYSCQENPPDILYLLCIGKETNPQCSMGNTDPFN